jgi:hypothetical protein
VPSRRTSLLAAGASLAVILVVVLVVALTRGGETPAPTTPPPTTATEPPPPPPPPDLPQPGEVPLALGLTEANPHLIAPGEQPPEFAPWRDRAAALRAGVLRVLVDWRRVQPSPDAPPDWSQPADGCLRGQPPCAAYSGIADELRAARAAGMTPLIVVLNTPDWAASPPSGCEAADAGAAARMPADLDAYRALIRSLLDFAAAQRIDLPLWAPWNEPNHPLFLGPQRAECDRDSAPLTPGLYAQLAGAMQVELDAAPGDQRLVLGETAGFDGPRVNAVGAAEFAAALPDELVCRAAAWGQHAYVKVDDELAADAAAQAAGSPELLRGVEQALDAHGCPDELPIWITETGTDQTTGAAGCRAMGDALQAWAGEPRVQLAVQYTFREDTAFPVGLADAGLTTLEPAYAAWLAQAQGASAPASACG